MTKLVPIYPSFTQAMWADCEKNAPLSEEGVRYYDWRGVLRAEISATD